MPTSGTLMTIRMSLRRAMQMAGYSVTKHHVSFDTVLRAPAMIELLRKAVEQAGRCRRGMLMQSSLPSPRLTSPPSNEDADDPAEWLAALIGRTRSRPADHFNYRGPRSQSVWPPPSQLRSKDDDRYP
jgi:hypothetical protein